MKQKSLKWRIAYEFLLGVIIIMIALAVFGFATAGTILSGQSKRNTICSDPKTSEMRLSIPRLGKDYLYLRCSESVKSVLFFFDLKEGRYRAFALACNVQQAFMAPDTDSPTGVLVSR